MHFPRFSAALPARCRFPAFCSCPSTRLTPFSFDWVSAESGGTNVDAPDLDPADGTPKFGIFSAAHVRAIGEDDEASGWIGSGSVPVPEPSTYAVVFGIAAALLVIGRRRRR